ncbi:hypothetical protein [Neogemmobacter tilapiae]|nr:hypothetical protein [Gemmobacter tilapiae]
MTLLDVIEKLEEFDVEATIYSCQPWTPVSKTTVCNEPQTGGLPKEAVDLEASYFLEIAIARDFVEDWLASQTNRPTSAEMCQRIIQYARDDA